MVQRLETGLENKYKDKIERAVEKVIDETIKDWEKKLGVKIDYYSWDGVSSISIVLQEDLDKRKRYLG